MKIEILRYVFWIVICIPLIAAGVWFCVRLFKENGYINKELDEIKREKELAAMKRDLFEVSYKKRRS